MYTRRESICERESGEREKTRKLSQSVVFTKTRQKKDYCDAQLEEAFDEENNFLLVLFFFEKKNKKKRWVDESPLFLVFWFLFCAPPCTFFSPTKRRF